MIKQLNILRFGLAAMIFLHHYGLYDGGGGLGVCLFLVISGFCYALGYGDRVLADDFDYYTYIKRRLIKIYPIHWFCLVLSIMLPYILGREMHLSLRSLIFNATLLHAWIPSQLTYFSYNAVSWYLSVALFLALLFPMLYRFIHSIDRKSCVALGVIGAIVYAVFYIGLSSGLRHAILYINPLFRVFDFLIGMIAAKLYLKYRNCDEIAKHPYRVDAVLILSLGVLIGLSTLIPRYALLEELYAIYWIPAIVLVLTISLERNSGLARWMSNPITLKLSQSSFSFYMIHLLSIWYMPNMEIFERMPLLGGGVVFFVAYIASQIMYYVFERPLHVKKRKT